MAEKYTRAVGTVQSNGVGGWSVDVELRAVWPKLTGTPYVAPRSAWTPADKQVLQVQLRPGLDALEVQAAITNIKKLLRVDDVQLWPRDEQDAVNAPVYAPAPVAAAILKDADERAYADARQKHDLRMRKLELEVEKLEAEVACKEADLLFSAACTRMKLAEASVLEAKAQLEWELMAQGRDRVEMRAHAANARFSEAKADSEERVNRLYAEEDARREAQRAESPKAPPCPPLRS